MIWTKVFDSENLQLFHALFNKMEIIKMIEKRDNIWEFNGCYILNLEYDNSTRISDFHFYTTNFFLSDSVKKMCIQPLTILNNDYKNDTDLDIDLRLETWFKNCKQIFHFDIDILGQSHGSFINEKYEKFEIEMEWDKISKIEINEEYYKKDIKQKLDNAIDGVITAYKLHKEEVVNIIIHSKKVTIDEIFD